MADVGHQDIKATVKAKTEAKTTNGDSFWKLELVELGRSGSTKCQMFNFGSGAGIKVGASYPFQIQKTDKGYRNIVGVGTEIGEEDPAWRDLQGGGGLGSGAASGPENGDARQKSIERQTALNDAVELAGYNIKAGQTFTAEQVVQVATTFNKWLNEKEG